MAKSVVCKLPHLFGKKLKISTEIYDIGQDGVCVDMMDHHADELLRLPVWDLDEPPVIEVEALAPPAVVETPLPAQPETVSEQAAQPAPKAWDVQPDDRNSTRKGRRGREK